MNALRGIGFTLLAVAGCGAEAKAPVVGQSSTLVLGPAGVEPSSITVTEGQVIHFENRDSAIHQIASAPHPAHTQCPELNGPSLVAGMTFNATIASGRTQCGFHDHLAPDDARFQGVVHVRARSSYVGESGGY